MPIALIGAAGLLGLVATASPDTGVLGEASFHRYEWRGSPFGRSSQAGAAMAVDRQGKTGTAWSRRREGGGG